MEVHLNLSLEPARFLSRPNRFIAHCLHRGEEVIAHIPNSGRLTGLLVPGSLLWLTPNSRTAKPRKTQWTARLVQAPDIRGLVSVDTRIPNLLVLEALRQRALPEFEGWDLVRPEYPMGNERIDFLLRDTRGRHLALEVKSVSMMQGERGFFPDAVTARGTRHLKRLAALAQTAGWCSGVLFVAQREDVFTVEAAAEIDPAFASALSEARASGVGLFARRCRITQERVILGTPIPVRA